MTQRTIKINTSPLKLQPYDNPIFKICVFTLLLSAGGMETGHREYILQFYRHVTLTGSSASKTFLFSLCHNIKGRKIMEMGPTGAVLLTALKEEKGGGGQGSSWTDSRNADIPMLPISMMPGSLQ